MNVPIATLKANPTNPRVLRDEKFAKLKQSLVDFPDMLNKRPIVAVTDTDGKLMVLGGNMRLRACQDLGMKEVPVILADEWTEEQRREFIIKDNVGFGEWDWDQLANEWDGEQLQDWGLDLPLDFNAETNEGLTDPDEVPEVPETPITVLGDVWVLGKHRLMCGDSTDVRAVERLMAGGQADFVYMDPPYGMKLDTDYSQNNTKQSPFKGNSYKPVEGDYEDYDPRPLIELLGTAREQFWWGADYYCHALIKNGSWVVWDKRNDTTDEVQGAAFELCWSINKHHKLIYRHMWCGYTARERSESRAHPTQKPVAMAEWFFDHWGKKADIVVDLYGGSGSTLIACEKTSRQCRMMELDPIYCDVIVKRWQDFTGQQAIHEASGKTFAELAEAQTSKV